MPNVVMKGMRFQSNAPIESAGNCNNRNECMYCTVHNGTHTILKGNFSSIIAQFYSIVITQLGKERECDSVIDISEFHDYRKFQLFVWNFPFLHIFCVSN